MLPQNHPASNSSISLYSFHISEEPLERERAPMAMMMEIEDDDVFFADLSRQISLLITDDEDDHGYYSPPISSLPAVAIQAFSTSSIFPSTQPQQYQFGQLSYKTCTKNQSKGTGVFIPTSSQCSRRRRSKHQTRTNTYNSYNNYKSFSHQQLPSPPVFSHVISHKKF